MNTTDIQASDSGFSMRRTFLTLLGAFSAFAILTASYATADLPATDDVGQVSAVVIAD